MASIAASSPIMQEPHQNFTQKLGLPPSPPATVKDPGSRTESVTDFQIGESSLVPDYRPYPLPPESRAAQRVLTEDLKTPDKHVPRDPRLLRLTGVHPFNVEAPLTELWNEGFITTKDLHYVRNHGPVPLVHDEDVLDWSFSVEGLVENPLTMTLRDLLADFEQVTYPITLVCAGNRRKEQNVVRKTKGFSWGPAGLSTALWTGVPLDILLAKAKPILRGGKRARYVCFEGADKLPNGYYGTSIKLNWATDPNRGVLVAHGMNGEVLPPDHGKPLRIVIPGQIGGRSVKWLKRIVVTEAPSDNWYHIYDNRVLPTTISPEESANLPETWKDERYAIYDLNTNSAMARPAHNERLDVSAQTFKFQGYAYAGGGRRITRVELTLDRGKSWRLAEVSYPEDQYRLAPEGEMLFGGRLDMSWRESCFCWCFWSLEIPVQDLVGDACTGDVMVRAMDDAMMVQPRDMYWSVLGMMNNPWFRVVIHREGHELRFEHPTQPILNADGWMDRVKKEGGNLSNGYWGEKAPGEEERTAAVAEPAKEIVMVNKDIKREISLDEVKQHEGEEEPWFVLDGEVYDGTNFLEGHPGGAASIIGAAGQDVMEEFMAIHSENAKAMMPSYHIGTLDAASKKSLAAGDSAAAEGTSEPRAVFLHPKTWFKAPLTCKTVISSDTKIFTFTLDHAAQEIGLPTGQHLMIRLRDPVTREAIIRAYTPLSDATVERGKLDVLIKIYRASGDGAQKGGLMTQALDSIPLGHWVEFKGPVGKFEYLGRGLCSIGGRERRVRRFVMVCAGSGITPIFAVLRAVLKDALDATHCLVLDGNRCEEDILCRQEMDTLVEGREERCKLVHTLSRPSDGWVGGRGRMDGKLFEKEVGPPSEARDELVLVCGPGPMEKSVRENFARMGWSEEDLLFF
ncbi:nitrate reductase [Diaporthe amygdali]|uniref:nitrate reductase n=1 Tax=Phomopsis amygdali TaxID=1214568 RepID=UPI0022FF1A89|nr:nitrate reductase [Diaporthe amygdali]KAJ0117948.1 nitrate reductase [Diaporthe amygdali]